jgi:hypothetical protein
MARAPRAIVREEPKETSAWSAVVLMASAVGAFALFALFLAYNHRWTDTLIARIPAPGAALDLANDGIIAEQLRLTDLRTEHLTLSDRSVALLFEATIVNDAAVPVRGIVIAVEGFRDGKKVAEGTAGCGKNVSERLLKRLSRDEVVALMALDTSEKVVLDSGARTGCQVALTGLRTDVDEVSYRIASAEPIAGHPSHDPSPNPGPGE